MIGKKIHKMIGDKINFKVNSVSQLFSIYGSINKMEGFVINFQSWKLRSPL